MSRYFRPEGVLYERVDGCLLLFCLVLVLLAPIFFLFEVLSEVHAVYFGPAADALRVISIVGLCLDGLLVIVGMVDGVLLLLKKGWRLPRSDRTRRAGPAGGVYRYSALPRLKSGAD